MANKAPSEQDRAPTTEEAALRRVATLVARESSPVEIFVAVTQEAARVLGCDAAGLLRFEADETATLMAQSDTPWDPPPLGTSFPLDGENAVVEVYRTGRAARVDDWSASTGAVGAMATVLGVRSGVASPVVVGDRLWGTIIAASAQSELLPADTEVRLARFTDLVSTAIANAEARDALARLAEEQAALRRVATLVADGIGPENVFSAVAAEVDRLFGADVSAIVRFEEDGKATVLGDVGGPHMAGKRVVLDPGYVVDLVRDTHQSARFDTDDPGAAGMPSIVQGIGIRSAVASPIVVDGAIWGAITAASVEGPLPSGAERRLSEFTELMATAVSNTQAQAAVRAAAEEQGALRRVATLVAASAPPSEVFAAVTRELARVLGANACLLGRVDDDGVVVVGTWADNPPVPEPGFHIPRGGRNLTTMVLDTGRPARLDSYDGTSGEAADVALTQGVNCAVGAPILVEGGLWGLVIAGRSGDDPLPPGAEDRLAAFAELVATAISNTESSQALERVAAEQAALRRVATLVAAQADPAVIFASVAEEVARTVDGERCAIGRLEGPDALTVIAYWSEEGQKVPVGTSFDVANDEVVAAVRESGRLLRIDDHEAFSGPLMDYARTLGSLPSSTIAAPVFVGGRIWGIIFTSTMASVLPEGTESRIVNFAELVATAISNAQARAEVQRLAEEQAALRRVATLVAAQAPQDEVFTAVAEGVAGVLGEELRLVRYEGEFAVVVAGSDGPHGGVLPVGTRLPVGGENALSHVFRTGRPARIDDYATATGPIAEAVRQRGLQSIVATPIVVEGRTWGAMIVGTFGEEPVPPETEGRLAQFAELMATGIANTEARNEIERLAEQEATLRRIATLVASGAEPEQVFEAVAKATAAAFGAIAIIMRFERDPPASLVVGLSRDIGIPIGTRWPFEDGSAATAVYRTGRSIRLSAVDWASQSGPFAEAALRAGVSSHVSSPILVQGGLWGVITLSGSEELPADTEERLERFAELVTTAIANTEARAEIERLADQQAALRRVATLVARREAPEAIFRAVADEAGGLLGADISALVRFESDDTVTVMAGPPPGPFAEGERVPLDPAFVVQAVRETGGPARFETADPAGEGMPDLVARFGVRSAVACPILVAGGLWGAIVLGSSEATFPPETERRLDDFSELVATGISNASARAELVASRARIVAAGDEARRRIERNLHDGTQQRLLALGLDLQRARLEIPEAQRDTQRALESAEHDLESILDDLRELSHGLHPPLLSRLGLGPSLQALARRSPIPVRLQVELLDRLDPSLETAVYYVVSEALANAIKHSHASEVTITISRGEGVEASIVDDGVGGADATNGSGLTGLFDRIDALGGSFAFDSPPDGGTKISVAMPLSS